MTAPSPKEVRIAKLTQAQEARKQECLNRVNQALERLEHRGVEISFVAVAKEADVSVSYLYKYPEVKLRIAELRNSQASTPRKPLIEPTSNQSHQKMISRLKERIRSLESEVTELKRRNEALAGQVHRVYELENSVARQAQRILELENTQPQNDSVHLQTASSKIALISTARISTARRTEVSEQIRLEIQSLGIHLSRTLSTEILKHDEASILEAIEAYKQYQTENVVLNPDACFLRAIEKEWVRNQNYHKAPSAGSTNDFEAFYKRATEAGFLVDVPFNHLPSDQYGQPLVKVNRPSGCFNWTAMPWQEAREEFQEYSSTSSNLVQEDS